LQGWYWSKRTSDENGWFYKTVVEWEEETGLTRSEQETARKHLKDILDVELRGVPATLYYRVNKEKILDLLGIQFAETLQTEIAEFPQSSLQDLRKFAGKLQSGVPANINKEPEISTMNPPVIQAGAGGVNIFRLYEENIGALTPMISEELKDAEKTFPNAWFEDAFKEAVTNNVRKWSYVLAILKRWKEQGRGDLRKQAAKNESQPPADDDREMTPMGALKRPKIAVEA